MKSSKLLAIAMGTLLSGAAMAQDSGTTTPSQEAQPEGPTTSETATYAAPGSANGPTGLEVGFRIGYAIPLGDLESGTKLSDFTSGMVPLQLDLGYRITPHWFAGAYFQFGFAMIKTGACGGSDCSAKDMRFGVEGQYHLMPAAQFDPWVGLGVGYEIMPVSLSAGNVSASESLKGFEFVNLAVGGDYKIAPTLGVGPFIGLSVGQYSSFGDLGDIKDKGTHMWLSFGVRGVFDVM